MPVKCEVKCQVSVSLRFSNTYTDGDDGDASISHSLFAC